MSFNNMKVEELRELADAYAVDINKTDNRAVILKKLDENGITWEYHRSKVDASKAPGVERIEPKASFDEPAEEDTEAKILLKMTRKNGTFEVRGAVFTQKNPYAIVKESDADFIIQTYEGFSVATPREVREFYK